MGPWQYWLAFVHLYECLPTRSWFCMIASTVLWPPSSITMLFRSYI